MFTARYGLSPYIKQTRLVFKGLIQLFQAHPQIREECLLSCHGFQFLRLFDAIVSAIVININLRNDVVLSI
jgi:hypothetical protein